MSALSAAQIAKGALRRLALAHQEPTPENYARAFAEEAGHAVPLVPERARPLIDKLVARCSDEPKVREELASALVNGRWDTLGQALERGAHAATSQSQAWASLLDRLVRGLERGSRQWSAARRKESLQRVLDSSGRDLARLQQRMSGLIGAWESDAPLPDEERALVAEGAGPAAEEAAVEAVAAPAAVEPAARRDSADAGPGTAWPGVVEPLRGALAAALPDDDARAAELADRLAASADRLAASGPQAPTLLELQSVCAEVRRFLGTRHQLVGELGRLVTELGQGLAELAEDESWARGQVDALNARLAEGINLRSVKSAADMLVVTRREAVRVRGERDDARDALKQLIHKLLAEIGELGAHTGRFHESVGRHAEAIERADSLEGLADVVRELVHDSRTVQDVVQQTHARMNAEHERAAHLEEQVRTLEGELRRLSEEVSTDSLTQVANRRGLAQAFAVEASRRERDGAGAPLAVGLIDIDNFKKLNDSLGHAAGDQALKTLAAKVSERLRPADHLARFGGEEFVVLLPATPLADAQQALTRLQRGLTEALFLHDGHDVFVTFSAGVTEWQPGEALEAALARADEALYEAKRAGKNRTCTI